MRKVRVPSPKAAILSGRADEMTDYSKLIDAETWAFIERTNSFYPADAVEQSVGEQRHTYDSMCRAFHAGHPQGVTATDTAIGTPTHRMPIRIYRNARPDDAAMVLYFHGGGFILGGLDDDSLAAFEWAARTYTQPVVLSGDSAGGNLAAAVAHSTRGHERAPIGQVLVYPGLGGKLGQGSYVTHADAPLLSVRDMDYYRDMRAGGRDISGDATFSPLDDTDYSGLPPTVAITAECDPLSDDGRDYRDRILAAGGKAVWINEQGLVHGYLRARHSVARARDSFTRIVEAVRTLGKGEWKYRP
jgi:acetyl esterase